MIDFVKRLRLSYNESIMPDLEISQLIRSRRAVRRYLDHPVPKELLERLFETALWAPSAHNRQPWRFVVLTDGQDKQRLAHAMGERLRKDRSQDGDPAGAIEKDVSRSISRITGAPVIIGVFLSMRDMDHYPDHRRKKAEETMAVQSVAMAAQNLWLLAHAEGLGACWLCAPLFVPELVREILELPPDWQAQGLLTLGWPAEVKEKTRRPWSESVRFL